MVNRFRQNLNPVRSQYVPQQYIPDFGAMANVLGQQQQAYDKALAVGEKVPQHLQTPEERAALEDYMSSIRSNIDELSQTYADEGVNAGNRRRKELLRTVGRDWQPGGKADRFQKRLATVQAAKEQIDKQYEDFPEVADYYKRQIQIMPFEEAENAANYGIGTPSTNRVLNEKETVDLYDKMLGNIEADQVVKPAYLDRSTLRGVSFKDLLRSGKTKFIDWNKAAKTLAMGTPQEVRVSEAVKGAARGSQIDESQIFEVGNDGSVKTDKNGNLQFANTNLGRMLEGFVTGKTYQQQDEDTKIVSDTFSEWLAKDGIKRKRDMQQLATLTQPFNRNKGMFADSVEIKDNKLLLKGTGKQKGQAERAGLAARISVNYNVPSSIASYLGSLVQDFFREDDKVALDSPQVQNTVRVLEDRGMFTKSNENGELVPMNEEEKLNTLANYLNRELERSTAQAVMSPIVDDNIQKNWNQILFNEMDNADNGTPGLLSNVRVYDQEGNVLSGTEFLREEVSEDKMANIEGEVKQPESLLPYGTRIFQVGDKEYRMEPLESDKQKPEYALNMLYRAQQTPLNNFSVEENLPPMPEVYTRPDGTQVPNELGKYINTRGDYKIEYTPSGYNVYRKEGTKEMKLNELPINLE